MPSQVAVWRPPRTPSGIGSVITVAVRPPLRPAWYPVSRRRSCRALTVQMAVPFPSGDDGSDHKRDNGQEPEAFDGDSFYI